MIDDFILYALLAGVLVAVAAGPLGCFLVWRRMAYFGDTISHSALMGVALGIALGTENPFVVVITCGVVALILLLLQRDRHFSSDTILGILAHTALSIGLIVIAMQEQLRQDMMYYLIGDILAITATDLENIALMSVLSLSGLLIIWKPLLSLTVHEDLARVEGVKVLPVKIIYMLLIAFLVAFAMKVIGVLLITALMIIPAAAARNISQGPVHMIVMSSLMGILAVFLGVGASMQWDIPTGPAIVLSASLIFLISNFKKLR